MSIKYNYYKRGEIIYVNFSPQVGSELWDPHYAIVLNKRDSEHNRILTVLPFSSKKKDFYLSLGKALFDQAVLAKNKIQSEVKKEYNSYQFLEQICAPHLDRIDRNSIGTSENFIPEETTNNTDCLLANYEEYKKHKELYLKKLAYLKSLETGISTLNGNSYRMVNQITSIDKQRIINNGSVRKILKGTRINQELLKSIDCAIAKQLINLENLKDWNWHSRIYGLNFKYIEKNSVS